MFLFLGPDLVDRCDHIALNDFGGHPLVGCPYLVEYPEVFGALFQDSLVLFNRDDRRHCFLTTGNDEVVVLVIHLFQKLAQVLTGFDRRDLLLHGKYPFPCECVIILIILIVTNQEGDVKG